MTISKFITTTTGPSNQPPVASLAYTKLDAVIGSIIQLDGRKSRDPEHQPLTFSWSFNQVPIGSNAVTNGFTSLRSNASAVSFTPDVTGLYVVQLVVNDGELDSEPITCVVNTQLSKVPAGEGLVPDAHFLWKYISNFWQLVEDREIFTTIWSSVIQLVGAELIKLWSNDYNKSLNTIQSTFQRRWVKYDASTDTTEDAQQRVITGKTLDGVHGQSGNVGEIPGTGYTSVFAVPASAGLYDFTQLEGNYGVKGRIISINGEGYTLSSAMTDDAGTLVVVDEEAIPEGIIGATWRVPHLLHTPGVDLEEDGVRAGDVLVFDVTRSDAGITAELRAQVVCVDRNRLGFEFSLEELETGGDTIERDLFHQLVQDLRIVPPSASDLEIYKSAEALISFIPPAINLAQRPFTPYRITFKAKKIIHNTMLVASDDVLSVPALQESVYEPPVVLRENLDYVVTSGAITFVSGIFTLLDPAPDHFWAENTVLDNADAIEDNFGSLVELGQDDLSEKQTQAPYLSAVKGLVYAYSNGPTVANIRLGLQILMGLPFTEERGVILEKNDEFSTSVSGISLGRLMMEDIDDNNMRTGFRRVYFYPTDVGVEYHSQRGDELRVGDVVEAFRPLSKGVTVTDYVKDPDWWKSALSGLEILKFFTFKITLDQVIFDSNDAAFALDFIERIKPKYTDVINTILGEYTDDIGVVDEVTGSSTLNFYSNPWWLEATNRPTDDNHLGVTLWPMGGDPFASRSITVLRDLTVFKDGTDVKVSSATGWNTDYVRAREDSDAEHMREGDLLFLHQGQPGAGTHDPGVYEIKTIASANEMVLGWLPNPGEFTGFDSDEVDEGRFQYGSGLTGVVMRREVNPVIQGDDLVTSVSERASSATAKFITNNVAIGDHLVVEEGPNKGEYLVDAVSQATPASAPLISEDTVKTVPIWIDPSGASVTTTQIKRDSGAIEDTLLQKTSPDANWGASPRMMVSDIATTNVLSGLIRLAASSIPEGTVTGFRLYVSTVGNSSRCTLSARTVKDANDWVAGTAGSYYSGATQAGSACHNAAKQGSQNWAGEPTKGCLVSGTDYDTDASPPTITMPNSEPPQYRAFDLDPQLAEDWRDGVREANGLLITGDYYAGSGVSIQSTEITVDWVASAQYVLPPYFEVDVQGPEDDVEYRVVRPMLQRRNLVNIRTVYDTDVSTIRAYDTEGNVMDVFTPSMVGMRIQVTNSVLPANNGIFLITGYRNRGEVETDSASTSTDTVDPSGEYPGELFILNELPGQRERITELSPLGTVELALKGDDSSPCFNRARILSASSFTVDSAYTPQGTPANPFVPWPPADATSNPVQLGLFPGDKIHFISHVSGGTGSDEGLTATISNPLLATVLNSVLTDIGGIYTYEVIRRLGV